MKLKQALKEIKQQEIAPIYLVLGTELALGEEFKVAIEKAVLQEEDSFNKVTIDLNEQPLSEGLLEAESLPFLGEKRLIFFESPTFLTGSTNNTGILHDTDALIDYLKAPLESSVVVFMAPYEKLDERKKVVKALKKAATIVEVAPLNEMALQKEITEIAKEKGIELLPPAKDRLLTLTNFNYSKLMQELEKLSIYKPSGVITLEDVNQLVPRTLQEDVFSLAQYLLQQKTEEALVLLEDLLTSGEEPLKINGILISQFRLYLQVKILLQSGSRKEAIASLLKVHPYRVSLAMKEVQRLSLPFLADLVDDLIEQDYQMKQSVMDKKIMMEMFLLKYGKK